MTQPFHRALLSESGLRSAKPFESAPEVPCPAGRIRILELGNPVGLYGAERWILALVRYLDRSAFEPIVAVVRDVDGTKAPLCEQAAALGLETVTIDAPGAINPAAVSALRKVIRERRIDILHTHSYKPSLLGLLAVMGTRCRIVATPHGWTYQPDLKLRCYELLDRLFSPFMDAVVPLSPELAERLGWVARLGGNVQMIPNGVDLAEIGNTGDLSSEIRSIKAQGVGIIGYIGRLEVVKGVSVLLDGFARLATHDTHLVVVGEGNDGDGFKNQALALQVADRCHFLGYRPDRLSILRGFDLLVLPSFSEGTPRCVMEAMAAGVPVVATDIPGCRRLVEDRKTGRIFPPGRADILSSILQELWQDPAQRDRLAHQARLFIASNYSAETMARRYEQLFRRLAATRHAG